MAKSIHTLTPLEIGGTVARRGFAVQDHVAAGLCLRMIEDTSLAQVWCESQDDVTLLWLNNSDEEVEFVQVKSNELDQLWTIAKLLEKEKRLAGDGMPKDGHCILQKSLQFDRCSETVRFRIVTCRDVKEELRLLTYELKSPLRAANTPAFTDLLAAISAKLGDVSSQNGNGCSFWIERTRWYVVDSLEAIWNANLVKVAELVQANSQFLAIDQIREIYQALLIQVHDAGLADSRVDPNKKKLVRANATTWFVNAVNDAVHPARNGTSKTLERKLNDAKVATDIVETAASLRRRYRTALLTPKYSDSDKRLRMEGEIEARLQSLRADLDCQVLTDDGVAFHARCLREVKAVHDSLPPKDRPPLQNLQGYMYNLADRCTHRFVRASA